MLLGSVKQVYGEINIVIAAAQIVVTGIQGQDQLMGQPVIGVCRRGKVRRHLGMVVLVYKVCAPRGIVVVIVVGWIFIDFIRHIRHQSHDAAGMVGVV